MNTSFRADICARVFWVKKANKTTICRPKKPIKINALLQNMAVSYNNLAALDLTTQATRWGCEWMLQRVKSWAANAKPNHGREKCPTIERNKRSAGRPPSPPRCNCTAFERQQPAHQIRKVRSGQAARPRSTDDTGRHTQTKQIGWVLSSLGAHQKGTQEKYASNWATLTETRQRVAKNAPKWSRKLMGILNKQEVHKF